MMKDKNSFIRSLAFFTVKGKYLQLGEYDEGKDV